MKFVSLIILLICSTSPSITAISSKNDSTKILVGSGFFNESTSTILRVSSGFFNDSLKAFAFDNYDEFLVYTKALIVGLSSGFLDNDTLEAYSIKYDAFTLNSKSLLPEYLLIFLSRNQVKFINFNQ